MNLERPLRADARLGGHFVLGHVDGVGRVTDFRPEGDCHWLEVETPAALVAVLIHKGSIAIDGISLTIASSRPSRAVGVQIVPFTFDHTALRETRPGDAVNLEADVIGKYVARSSLQGDVRGMSRRSSSTVRGTRHMSRSLHLAKGRRRKSPFAPVDEAIDAIRAGQMIIVVDDEDRENEGDLTMAASTVTPDAINFMVTHGRGLVCLAMTPERLDQLDIPLEVVRELVAPRHRDVRVDRRQGRHDDGRLGGRSRADDSDGDRARIRSRAISRGPAMCFRCVARRAACWCAPATPKPPSISRGSRACRPRA